MNNLQFLRGAFPFLAASLVFSCAPMPDDIDDASTDELIDEEEGAHAIKIGLSPFAGAALAAHNALRTNASLVEVGLPPANPPLIMLTWDDDIAATAQAWADQHIRAHSSGGYRYPGAGENMYYYLSPSPTKTCSVNYANMGQAASNMWGNERFVPAGDWTGPHELFPVGSLSGIGHYTQMIWGDAAANYPATTRMGCGVSSGISSINGWYECLVVCQYHSHGNILGVDAYRR